MEAEVLDQAEEILGYAFRNPAILKEALTHASVAGTRLTSNERMEFLGDAILGMVVCDYLYNEYSNLLEGDLTKIKSAVVSRRTCSQMARELGLDRLLKLGKGMSERNDMPQSISAAALESVIAAIHLDGGIDEARKFILRHLVPKIQKTARNGHQYNFKSILQQYAQHEFGGLANYLLLDENGPDHAKCFKVCVEIGEKRFPSSWASTKKQSEQRAALNALLDLNVAWIDQVTEEIHLDASLLEV